VAVTKSSMPTSCVPDLWHDRHVSADDSVGQVDLRERHRHLTTVQVAPMTMCRGSLLSDTRQQAQ
jgi:hypothetical protein